tara:strand:+ start:6275 stop:7543 length:1269 start_codon:yes stop_codon:yes gene_type:complete
MINKKLMLLAEQLHKGGLTKEAALVDLMLKNAFLIGPHTPFIIEVAAPVVVEVAAPAVGMTLLQVAQWLGLGSLVLLSSQGGAGSASNPLTLEEMDEAFVNRVIKHISQNLDNSMGQVQPFDDTYSTYYETSGGADIDMDISDIDPNWDTDSHDPNDTDTDIAADADIDVASYDDEMSADEAMGYLEALKEFYEDNRSGVDTLIIDAAEIYNLRDNRYGPGEGELVELRPNTNVDAGRSEETDNEEKKKDDKQTNLFCVFAERKRDGPFEGWEYHFFKGGRAMAEYISGAIELSVEAQRIMGTIYGGSNPGSYQHSGMLSETDPYKPIATLKSLSIGTMNSSTPPSEFSGVGVVKNSMEICGILFPHLPPDDRSYQILNVSSSRNYFPIISVISQDPFFGETMLVYRSAAIQSTHSIGTGVC